MQSVRRQLLTIRRAMAAFSKEFGHYNEKKGKYQLDTYFLSLLNSLVYIGFAAGKSQRQDLPTRS